MEAVNPVIVTSSLLLLVLDNLLCPSGQRLEDQGEALLCLTLGGGDERVYHAKWL